MCLRFREHTDICNSWARFAVGRGLPAIYCKSWVNFGLSLSISLSFDLSCKNTKQNLGAMFTRTNYVTLKYVTDNWGTESNGFKLVITAVKDPSK
ncbi:hypothetical protein D910_03435 [Dendroctonus ponderosae]|uniref:CUB domain-containing protein n=1 Tax=Dendroctonus ponderosae TaxID=77166 RepID=U4U5Y0_DENPD|nr:hypothetical protein D910_03435 [Dendroctonus ponderosae]